jgi:hypothetical protein
MSISPSNPARPARSPWPVWARALVLIVGAALSAAAGYVAAVGVMIVAVLLGAAPLLAGESTPQQPWVTPVAVGAGLIGLGLGLWLTVRAFRRAS